MAIALEIPLRIRDCLLPSNGRYLVNSHHEEIALAAVDDSVVHFTDSSVRVKVVEVECMLDPLQGLITTLYVDVLY